MGERFKRERRLAVRKRKSEENHLIEGFRKLLGAGESLPLKELIRILNWKKKRFNTVLLLKKKLFR